jgi:hypothetical protein
MRDIDHLDWDLHPDVEAIIQLVIKLNQRIAEQEQLNNRGRHFVGGMVGWIY